MDGIRIFLFNLALSPGLASVMFVVRSKVWVGWVDGCSAERRRLPGEITLPMTFILVIHA
jgi:hypothetical protein